ncbi:hypothetical protein OG906_02935 [Streptomyces sp. NBC_01426]|uniref:hypothetical protein n=1 Tax=Streptomyces sp. NBC_01426 TaxID=2975866 RepID=UPI002E352B0B|nr:hypothetical protein [Streptomyces sp. NBC_01426]
MRALNKWLATHLWAQALFMVAIGAGVILLLSPGRSPMEAVVRAAVGAVGALGVLFLARRRERRAAGGVSNEEYASLDDRLRHGEVPESADERADMGRLVQERLRATRHRRVALAFLALMFTAIVVLVGFTAGGLQTVVFVVFAAGFLGWMAWTATRQHRVLRKMAATLDVRPR